VLAQRLARVPYEEDIPQTPIGMIEPKTKAAAIIF
jgi:hypothetical protein